MHVCMYVSVCGYECDSVPHMMLGAWISHKHQTGQATFTTALLLCSARPCHAMLCRAVCCAVLWSGFTTPSPPGMTCCRLWLMSSCPTGHLSLCATSSKTLSVSPFCSRSMQQPKQPGCVWQLRSLVHVGASHQYTQSVMHHAGASTPAQQHLPLLLPPCVLSCPAHHTCTKYHVGRCCCHAANMSSL